MVSAGMQLVKYLLFIFNFVFWVTGIAILSVGAWAHIRYSHYFRFAGSTFLSAPVLLIIVGSVIIVIAFFGCCGAIRENHCMIITFSVLLGIIFILELAAGIAAYVLRGDLKTFINDGMKDNMKNYNKSGYDAETKTWDAIQHDLTCCGINGSSDWSTEGNFPRGETPDSCCDGIGCGKDPAKEKFKDGCFIKVFNMSDYTAYVVGGVGLGIAFVQIIGIIFACCLGRAIKREYEVV